MIHFNKENDELLINLIRSNPILYDGSEKNYKNIALKHRVWEDISETLKIPGKCLYYILQYKIISSPIAKSLFLEVNICYLLTDLSGFIYEL